MGGRTRVGHDLKTKTTAQLFAPKLHHCVLPFRTLMELNQRRGKARAWQAVNIFHLVEGFHVCETTQEMFIRYRCLFIRYFSERS